ncbi:thioredoxin (plasmid) [Brevibacillus laterosporus]|uniref:thioredoxin family protein n=1 Tax=Brevibacillus laterosporus TaxID=1465 RepID=UPI000E6C3048|nr:thioredoxin family protein [Brevibacillus laterosporus]AYB41698.1 thioredoxin [Brevibacillus laterosporus]MED1786638.1 thioredoxin family protein [Brevibacillus laterosporus]
MKILKLTAIFLTLFTLVISSGCQSQTKNEVSSFNENQIENIESLKKRISTETELYVYFYQPSCSFCQEVEPYLLPLGKSSKIPFTKIDLSNNQEGWNLYKVDGTPTVIHFKDGNEFRKVVGALSKEDYSSFFSFEE